jgi:DNA-3-methyladenine glycosylase II
MLIALGREDVVLPGDLALRKAVQAAYRLDHLPAQQEVLAIAEKGRPYRSLATSYLFSESLGRYCSVKWSKNSLPRSETKVAK